MLRWTRLAVDESSPRAARLAHALAATAENLPADRRAFVRSLAHELTVWPVDGRVVDAAQFIADCQTVLLLPLTEPIEVRVAAAPAARLNEKGSGVFGDEESNSDENQLPPRTPDPLPPAPPTVLTIEPSPPPAATATPSNAPQLFVPGRSLRISDE